MEDDGDSPKLLSIRDTALATGLTPKAVRRRIERGTIASVMVGGRRRIAVQELLNRGLLVPLDGEGRAPLARPARRPAAGGAGLTARVRGLEHRVAVLESELRQLRG